MYLASCSADSQAVTSSNVLELNCGHRVPTHILRDHAREFGRFSFKQTTSHYLQIILDTKWETDCPICYKRISNISILDPGAETSLQTDAMLITAVRKNHNLFQYASEAVRNDKRINLQLIEHQAWILKYSRFNNDADVVLAALNKNALTLQFIDPILLKDKKFIIAAVKLNGYLLENFKDYQNDEEVVEAAVTIHGLALEYASVELKNIKRIVLAAVSSNGKSLKYASEDLRSDEEIVQAAVKNDGCSLKYAISFRNHKSIVLDAISNNGLALEYASRSCRNDPDIVLAAVKQNGYAYKFATSEMKKVFNIALNAVRQNGQILEEVDHSFKSNKEIVLAAVSQFGFAIRYAPSFANDREVATAAITQNAFALELTAFRNDRAMVELAIENDPGSYAYASVELKKDPQIMLKTVQMNGLMLEYFRNFDKKIALAAVTQNGNALEYALWYKSHPRVIEAAVKQNSESIKYAVIYEKSNS